MDVETKARKHSPFEARAKLPWPGKKEERRCVCGGVYVTSKTMVRGNHSWLECRR